MDARLVMKMVVAILSLCASSAKITAKGNKCVAKSFEDIFPIGTWNPCFKCACENEGKSEICMFVREECPKLTCSFREMNAKKCCKVCKGCYVGKRYRKDKEIWSDAEDNCTKYQCNEGVISNVTPQCRTECKNENTIRVPGQCCPRCKGCLHGKRIIGEGKNVTTDPCTTCTCQNGSLACVRQTCPQLYCLNPETKEGKCCPECTLPEERTPRIVDEKETSCFIKELKLENGKKHRMDKCTSCECMNGTLFCIQQRCVEDMNCKKKDMVKSESHCCPVCKDKITCKHGDRVYQNRERWFLRGCAVCQCMDGHIMCKKQICEKNLRCPKGYVTEYRPGSCCLECVEEKKTCISFGDPHYRTFDGKAYSYQGICKYTLVKDCTEAKTFNIITRNDGRYANTFSWIRSVVFKYANLSISLQQNYRVKINGRVVKIPLMYKSRIDIRRIKRYIYVYTYDGITVKWDGDSYVAVSVPKQYRDKVCGLCGNYNDDPYDDLTLPNGLQVQSEKLFGDFWIKKGSKSCKRNSHLYNRLRFSSCLGWKFFKAHKVCSKAFSDPSIVACRDKVAIEPYFQDCVTDVCQCPHGKQHCECGAIRSYYEPCSKEFKSLVWKRKLKCDNSCSGGSVYSTCGSNCRNTCDSLNSVEMCPQQCVAGCHCTHGKVWHKNKCIHPMDCP